MKEVAGDVMPNSLRELAGLTRARIRENRELVKVLEADRRSLMAELVLLERLLAGEETGLNLSTT